MSRKRLSNEERAEVFRLWKEEGLTYEAIAEQCDICVSTVGKVVKKMNSTPQKSQINEEFDAAVDQMIEESKNEDTKKDTLDTKSDTPNVPDAVIQAVADKIETLSAILSDNLLTIKKMQQDNENLRSELAILYGWRAEHEGAEN